MKQACVRTFGLVPGLITGSSMFIAYIVTEAAAVALGGTIIAAAHWGTLFESAGG
jgi:hypothetical protein